MTQPASRSAWRAAPDVLLVLRDPPAPPPPAPGQPPIVPGNPAEGQEILLAVHADGRATVFHGHVDLGTGIRTALGQIAAEELGWPAERVSVQLGHTAVVPNQGPTIASATLQIHGVPLRHAAAQAAAWLRAHGGTAALAGRHVELTLDLTTPVKAAADYTVVGTSQPRVDIPSKVMPDADAPPVFVHDLRVPGMLHGRVIRPPYAGLDAGEFVGRTLEGVDAASIAHIPGVRAVVTLGDFVGVVAEREEHAEQAMRELVVRWKAWPGAQPLDDLAQALRSNPAKPRVVAQHGDVAAPVAQPLDRTYVWPYQLHASIGPSCAVADVRADAATVWAGTQNPHVLRADLARLTGLADTVINVVRLEASGCYGRNGADDVAADAVLLSRAVSAPVRVQLTREQEHAWEPKGAAQLMDVHGGLDEAGRIAAYDFTTSYPSNAAPTLALLLTRTVDPVHQVFEMGDRTSVPPYDARNLKVTVNDMPPMLRASWLRGVSALPNSFAHESWIDEAAHAAGQDPVAFRLAHLKDDRAAELVRATAAKAGWVAHTQPQQQAPQGDWLPGQGFAYARYIHSKFPGFGAAWSAWVADVEVHQHTGEVHVKRVVVGHDAGLMVNPAGVTHQVHGNVVQTTSRALHEQVRVDAATGTVATRDWGAYPILSFREVPVVEVLHMPRPGEPPLGAGESASVPGTAAIANAIFDATGVRFRAPPFTPEVVRAALHPLPPPERATAPEPAPAAQPAGAPDVRRKPGWAIAAAAATGLLALAGAALGWRPAIAPVNLSQATTYSAELIERGRQLASIGDCMVCHTAEGGAPNAGGRAFHTPFGTVHSTNLTPDAATGLGAWSFTAFQRAMREGMSRDGRHLYPAFPYTAFTRMTDDDLMALYAYLQSQPAVSAVTPAAQMQVPRPVMALWNALHLVPGAQVADATKSALWNRGAYLVEGAGHCSACHTPRSALGAEDPQRAYAGALVEGWEAPPLNALSRAPVAWNEAQLFAYLRHGVSAEHGSASGPMAPVVQSLADAPDDDLRAMAHYLASLQQPAPQAPTAAQVVARAAQRAPAPSAAARQFEAACGACHHDGDGPMTLGPNVPLALNSNLHSDRPDNLIRVILDGVREPAHPQLGQMQGFRAVYDDRQMAELVAWMRQRFAPGRPAWRDLPATVARLRAGG